MQTRPASSAPSRGKAAGAKEGGLRGILNQGERKAPTPAQDELKEFLKKNGKRYPPILRFSLILAAACAGAMLLLVGLAFIVDRRAFLQLLTFIGLTTVAGPQAATLGAFGANPPLGLGWVMSMTLLNMLATLCFIIPMAWRGLEGLRENRFFGGLLMSAEHLASKRRHFLARWGLAALAVIAALPVQGAGVLGAGIVGVLLRVPLRRLLLTLAVVGAALNVAWIFVLRFTESQMPSGGLWDLVPWLIIAAIIGAGAIASYRGRKQQREIDIETFGWIDSTQARELKAVGIKGTQEMMRVDLRKLAKKIGIPDDAIGRARNVAGLIRLNSVQPDEAVRLTAIGVTRIRDLAVTPPRLVYAALQESGARDSLAETGRWRDEAEAFLAETAPHRSEDEEPLPDIIAKPS